MKEKLTDKEIKESLLGILEKFDEICKAHNLEYSLAYGTMLGAVRHKGFIPWDDDVDIFMKRADYEKLLSLHWEDKNYEIKSSRYTKDYFYLFAKMVDKNTQIREPWRAEKNMGLFVDIFPIDYVDFNSSGEQLKKDMNTLSARIAKADTISGILGHKMAHHKSFSPRYIAKFLFKTVTLPFRKQIIKNSDLMLVKEYNNKGSYCVQPSSDERRYYSADLFNGIEYVDFEGIKAPIYKNYDKLLTIKYGDYMTLPPVEEQISNHWFEAYKK